MELVNALSEMKSANMTHSTKESIFHQLPYSLAASWEAAPL